MQMYLKKKIRLYSDIVAVLVGGTYADYEQFEDFLGYFLAVDGYELLRVVHSIMTLLICLMKLRALHSLHLI